MNSATQTETAKRVYGYKAWLRVLYVLLGLLLAGGGLLGGFLAYANGGSAPSLFVGAFLVPFGVYTLAVAFRSRIAIEGARIAVRGAFQERSAELDEIEGFRTVQSRNGSYQQLILKQGRGTISIPSGFSTDDDFRAWFQQIPDLDQRDREALLKEIEADQELGGTPGERLDALNAAKTRSYILIAIAAAAAVAVNVGEAGWQRLAAVVLILAPWAAAYLLWRSPLLYAIFRKKADPRAEMMFPLLIAGFGLLFRMRGIETVSLQPLLFYMAIAAIGLVFASFKATRRGINRGALVGVLVLAGLYCYGAVTVGNAVLDLSKGTGYETQVIGRHINDGKSTSYHLRLAPFGPVETDKDATVSSSVYEATSIGDTVCLELHPGALRAPWFRLVPCSAPAE